MWRLAKKMYFNKNDAWHFVQSPQARAKLLTDKHLKAVEERTQAVKVPLSVFFAYRTERKKKQKNFSTRKATGRPTTCKMHV